MEASPVVESAEGRALLRGLSKLWWLWLVFGIAWIVIALVILQFDQASITTVGVLIGIMFFVSGIQQFAIAGARRPRRLALRALRRSCSSSPG